MMVRYGLAVLTGIAIDRLVFFVTHWFWRRKMRKGFYSGNSTWYAERMVRKIKEDLEK